MVLACARLAVRIPLTPINSLLIILGFFLVAGMRFLRRCWAEPYFDLQVTMLPALSSREFSSVNLTLSWLRHA